MFIIEKRKKMKIMWNKTLIIVYLMTFFSLSWLFGDDEPSVVEWGIEDYKKTIMSEYLENEDEILEFEEFAAFETGEKYFLCKRSSKWMDDSYGIYRIREDIYFSLFCFNKNHEFTEELIGLSLEEKYIEAFVQGIPGIRLWDAPVFIGDFNNDGQKEIASFFNTASAPSFEIWSIDLDSKNLVRYFSREVAGGEGLNHSLSPVEFIKYKNMEGFKMLRMEPLEISNVKYPYVDYEGYSGYKGFVWFFYTWDEREKEYVFVEEFDPYYSIEEIDSYYSIETKNDMQKSEEELSFFQYDVNEKKSNIYIYVVIIFSIIIFAAFTVFIIIKKKRN
jgi:hypothetical protein